MACAHIVNKSFAPGRVELLGNHTDYNAGVVLSASLDLGVAVEGTTRDDGKILLSWEGEPGEFLFDAPERTERWTDYPLGVVALLCEAGHRVGGFTAHFSNTLPFGSGLSSSAAIEVATAFFLARTFSLDIAPMDMARLCRRAECEFVGVNCGLLDQASSIFGRAGHVIFLDCRTETIELDAMPSDYALLIINSGVKHALTGGEYNERRAACFEAAKILGVPFLRDATSEQLARADMPEIVRRRAAHVIGENERVFAAREALHRADATTFGHLMLASHESSRHNFENSTSELDCLVELAAAHPGILGARLTGGGFGGSIVSLGHRDALPEAAEKITKLYTQKTSHHATPLICSPGNGALATQA